MDSKSLISIILCNLALNPLNHYLNSYLSFSPFLPKAPTTLHVSASHQLEVPADRALISIHVKSKGTNQASVSDDIYSTQKDLMALLRPLTETPTNTSLPYLDPPITHLGVNTFSANSHRTRQTLLGEKPVYEASAEYSAEFADLDVLADVYFKLSSFPRVRIDSIEWKLSEAGREDAIARCHQAASRMLMTKARNTMKPLGLNKLRVVDLMERDPRSRWDHHQHIVLMDADELVMHDEMDDPGIARMRAPAKPQFEPRRLGYEVHLDARLEAS